MIKKLIDGICLALSSCFGDEREIYTEAVEQGLEDGSFLIECLNPTNSRFMGERYYRTNQFCIHYFSETKEPNSECLDVLEDLYDALETIEVEGDLVRGTNMTSEMDEGVLHFFVNYNFFTISERDKTLMEEFEQTFDVKG